MKSKSTGGIYSETQLEGWDKRAAAIDLLDQWIGDGGAENRRNQMGTVYLLVIFMDGV